MRVAPWAPKQWERSRRAWAEAREPLAFQKRKLSEAFTAARIETAERHAVTDPAYRLEHRIDPFWGVEDE